MTETTIRGYRMRHLATWETRNALLDSWENLDVREGRGYQTAAVVTFPIGKDAVDVNTGEPDLEIPGDRWAMAYTDHPASDPADRFQEADRQERERAEERMTGGEFRQVYPPADD